MDGPTLKRHIAPSLALLAIAVPAGAAGGVLNPKPQQPVVSTSGDNGELIKRIPIARRPAPT